MIKGIKIIKLVTHKDERGFFREILRLNEHSNEFNNGQLSHSEVNMNVLKAWHGHKIQSQWNYVICGLIKVVLYDFREESPTYEKYEEFLVGKGHLPTAYYFPSGVLHSYKCIIGPMNILYLTSGNYDSNEEIRISKNNQLIKYHWK